MSYQTQSTAYGVTSTSGNLSKGSWSTLISSTSEDVCALLITITSSITARSFLIDIGVGGAGSETVIVPNLPFSTGDAFSNFWSILVPVSIAAGSRIAVRSEANTSSS